MLGWKDVRWQIWPKILSQAMVLVSMDVKTVADLPETGPMLTVMLVELATCNVDTNQKSI